MADDETTEAPRPDSTDTDRRRAAGTGLVIQLIGTAAVVGLAWVMTRHYVRYLQQQAAAGVPAPCAGCAEKQQQAGREQAAAEPIFDTQHPGFADPANQALLTDPRLGAAANGDGGLAVGQDDLSIPADEL
jgi:hypothetical protein